MEAYKYIRKLYMLKQGLDNFLTTQLDQCQTILGVSKDMSSIIGI